MKAQARTFRVADAAPGAASPVERAESEIRDALPVVLEALIDLALGATVRAVERGEEKIYVKPPDRQACEYLINRAMGKIPDRVDVGADNGPVQFTVRMGEAAIGDR